MEIPTIELTPEFLAILGGAVLSALFTYFPKLNTWYAGMDEGVKKLIMVGLLLVLTAGLFGLTCIQVLNIVDFACDKPTAIRFVWLFFFAAFSNQTTFKMSPLPLGVRIAKLG